MKNDTPIICSKANVQPTSLNVGWNFDHSYARLPEVFHAQLAPIPVQDPQVVILNHELAASLGLDLHTLSEQHAAALFSGNVLPDSAHPIAQAYAGHQFGHFTMLGDGRAILLGEHLTSIGERFDIQFKGSGQTPFSRRGDGRAALAPMLREYIISEAMHALNIPTTRSLAVVTTGEWVLREKPLPGAILTRVAASHIRVGTFQYAAGQSSDTAIKMLADYVIQRHYPTLNNAENPYLSLLDDVIERQAALVAQWMLVGFIHGVMNTDNMSICGQTIDYGPCAFIDSHDPKTVFSSIDQYGRYRYENQPLMAQWNLARFAETLLPLLDPSQEKAIALAEQAIHSFSERYQSRWMLGMRKKLGLLTEETEDTDLITALLNWMHRQETDYTNLFRALSLNIHPEEIATSDAEFFAWHARWKSRLSRQPGSADIAYSIMLQSNPAIIPRNHCVEDALSAASEQGDLSPLKRLLSALANPFADIPQFNDLRNPPASPERNYQTFCGT